MKGLLCHDCQHFHQHYIKDNEWCVSVCCGHCTYPRLKSRKPDTPACNHFVQPAAARHRILEIGCYALPEFSAGAIHFISETASGIGG